MKWRTVCCRNSLLPLIIVLGIVLTAVVAFTQRAWLHGKGIFSSAQHAQPSRVIMHMQDTKRKACALHAKHREVQTDSYSLAISTAFSTEYTQIQRSASNCLML